MNKIIFFLLLFFINVPAQDTVKVLRVIDGDTFVTTDNIHVRLIGIDCPELRERGGKEAKEYATKKILGKKIILEYDFKKFDKYNRTLAYVFLLDGTFLNKELIENGYAEGKYYTPNKKYSRLLK